MEEREKKEGEKKEGGSEEEKGGSTAGMEEGILGSALFCY